MHDMYTVLVALHSVLRWFVLLAGLYAIVRGVMGWGGKPWGPGDRVAGRAFVGLLDLQFVIGIALYLIFSPVVGAAMSNIGAAMRDPMNRFFLVEHPAGMIIAIALAHVGNVKIRKATDDTRRHRLGAVFFGLSLFLILLSIPWPGTPAGRPLWPF